MMELIQHNRCFDGEQRIYAFNSKSLKGQAKFGIFLPPSGFNRAALSSPILFGWSDLY